MKDLTVKTPAALKAWREADKNGRVLLENLYGSGVFKNQNATDRIKTFEDALEETGRPNVTDYSMLPKDLQAYFENKYKAIVIAEALNEGWIPNWDDSNEQKWTCWFIMSPSGFRFYASCYDSSYAYAGSGSRLCFKTEALIKYAVAQFPEVFKNIQIG